MKHSWKKYKSNNWYDHYSLRYVDYICIWNLDCIDKNRCISTPKYAYIHDKAEYCLWNLSYTFLYIHLLSELHLIKREINMKSDLTLNKKQICYHISTCVAIGQIKGFKLRFWHLTPKTFDIYVQNSCNITVG